MWNYKVQPECEGADLFASKLAQITIEAIGIPTNAWNERKMRMINLYFTQKYFGLDKQKLLDMWSGILPLPDTLTKLYAEIERVDVKPITEFFEPRAECKGCGNCRNQYVASAPWTSWVGVRDDAMPARQGCNFEILERPDEVFRWGMGGSANGIGSLVGPTRGKGLDIIQWWNSTDGKSVRLVFDKPIPDYLMTEFTGKKSFEFEDTQEYLTLMQGIIYLFTAHGSYRPQSSAHGVGPESIMFAHMKSKSWEKPLEAMFADVSNDMERAIDTRKKLLTDMEAIRIVNANYKDLIIAVGGYSKFMEAYFTGRSVIDVAAECLSIELAKPVVEVVAPVPAAEAPIEAQAVAPSEAPTPRRRRAAAPTAEAVAAATESLRPVTPSAPMVATASASGGTEH